MVNSTSESFHKYFVDAAQKFLTDSMMEKKTELLEKISLEMDKEIASIALRLSKEIEIHSHTDRIVLTVRKTD